MWFLIPLIVIIYAIIPKYPSFTLYYATWCKHCSSIKPIFQDFRFPGVAIQCVQGSPGNENRSYPTWIYTDSNGLKTVYNGPRTPEGWTAFLQEQNKHPM